MTATMQWAIESCLVLSAVCALLIIGSLAAFACVMTYELLFG